MLFGKPALRVPCEEASLVQWRVIYHQEEIHGIQDDGESGHLALSNSSDPQLNEATLVRTEEELQPANIVVGSNKSLSFKALRFVVVY